MRVVDPHMHLCNLDQVRYPWLEAPVDNWLIGAYGSSREIYLSRRF